MDSGPIIVVGAGVAGVNAVHEIRRIGYGGRVILVDQQREIPYDRPPLTKELLQGKIQETAIYFYPERWYVNQQIELVLGSRVERIETGPHQVYLNNHKPLRYHKLLVATGLRGRMPPIPGIGLANIHTLRTLADYRLIRDRLRPGQPVVVVGGGFIGLEVAASLRQLRHPVTIVEQRDKLGLEGFPARLATWLERTHRDQGVTIVLRDSVQAFQGTTVVEEVLTVGGRQIPCAMVVLAVGSVVNGPLKTRLKVDEFGRTEWNDCYAAGDCTAWPNNGQYVSYEHWDHAIQHSGVVAHNLIRPDMMRYEALPYFWSDQYQYRVQCLGRVTPTGVVRGEVPDDHFIEFYLENSRMVGALLVNAPRDATACRRLIERRVAFDPRWSNEQISLKILAAEVK